MKRCNISLTKKSEINIKNAVPKILLKFCFILNSIVVIYRLNKGLLTVDAICTGSISGLLPSVLPYEYK
jgi:hypothetical protein